MLEIRTMVFSVFLALGTTHSSFASDIVLGATTTVVRHFTLSLSDCKKGWQVGATEADSNGQKATGGRCVVQKQPYLSGEQVNFLTSDPTKPIKAESSTLVKGATNGEYLEYFSNCFDGNLGRIYTLKIYGWGYSIEEKTNISVPTKGTFDESKSCISAMISAASGGLDFLVLKPVPQPQTSPSSN